jgi:DNA-binding NarL/FixJ family response regulator
VTDVDQLRRAIVAVNEGGSVIDPQVVDGLVARRARMAESPVARLTPREREVLAEMAQGKNNAGIAASLVLTDRAVEKHINSMFMKLGLSEETDVHRRVKAVLLYLGESPAGR